ncbi:hypothetical protein [Roseateles aquae]|nr:hypothetical protein [Paucibacter sp. APW11]
MRPAVSTGLQALAFGVSLLAAGAAQAGDELAVSGFATLGVGKALSGVTADYYSFHCPCYIANYPDVGIYEKSWSLKPDSRAGVQATYRLSDKFSLTGQVTGHAANDMKPTVDWAYATWNLSDTLTLQAGRKRLPLFGYSDFFQVGYAYPWIRPPGDLYGWQIVAYNGANLQYRGTLGSVSVSANAWVGTETDKDNRMLGLVYYGDKTEETWKGIMGAYVEFGTDWGSLRLVAMRNKVDRWLGSGATRTVNKADVKQQFYGITFNVDKDDWVLRSEINRFERPDSPKDIYNVYFLGVGRRFGDWLPMLTYSRFTEDYKDDPTQNEKHNTWSATLRWDFRSDMALKLQYDIFKDRSAFTFVGDSKALAISLDYLF